MRALVVGLLLVGCSCDHGPPVPFGLEGQRGDVVVAAPGDIQEPAITRPDLPADAQEWPEGAAVSIGGIGLRLDGASIRATLTTDLDADGDDDVILVGLGAAGPVLFAALRNGAEYGTPSPITWSALAAPDPTCVWSRVAFAAASREAAILAIERDCPEDATSILAIRLDARPRVLETFTFVHGPTDSGSVSLADRDDDGHDDVVLSISLATEADGPATGELVYFDRPAGLSRDTTQPEASIAAALAFERPVARRHPDRLAPGARRAVAIHDALCGATSRVTIGTTRGAPCATSAALGQAFVVLTAAAAHAGDALHALDALAALDRADVSVRDVDRTIATGAIASMTGVLTPPAHDSVDAQVVSGTGVRLSTLAFLEEDRVLVRGAGQVVTLSTGETSSDASGVETAMRDPSAQFSLVELRGTCGGPSIVIEAGPLGLSERHTLPATTRPACTGEDRGPAPIVDGWVVLGWAPQGVLLARGAALELVPLDIQAHAAGEPTLLALDAPPPAPIAAGNATSDASAWAVATSSGIVVMRRAEQDARLVRPSGFTAASGAPFDVAVSPSTERIAWIEGGHLRWAALAEPAPPPAPTTTPL